jgi:hypothetical protein
MQRTARRWSHSESNPRSLMVYKDIILHYPNSLPGVSSFSESYGRNPFSRPPQNLLLQPEDFISIMTIHNSSIGDLVDAGKFSHCQLTAPGAKDFPTVKKIELWFCPRPYAAADRWVTVICGIQVTYTDGNYSPLFGEKVHEGPDWNTSFVFQDGEVITELWVGKKLDVWLIGSIDFYTNKGRHYEAGVNRDVHSSGQLSVHSGILLGISGGLTYSGGRNVFGNIGLYFLEELASIDMKMDFLTTPDPGSVSKVEANIINGDNRQGRAPMTLSLELKKSATTSATTEESWADELGVSLSVSSGFFGIGEVSATTEFTYSETHTKSSSYQESTEITWGGSVVVAPGDYTIVDQFYYTARYQVEYKATIILKGKSGSQYTLARFGNMNGTTAGIATYTQRHIDRNGINGVPPNLYLGPVEETFNDDDMPPNTNEPVGGGGETLENGDKPTKK